jgi:acyl-coenzyme A synthetase/AMP-(fatty) acid ligase
VSRYNAGEWLLDRRLAAGDGERVAYVVEGTTTTYAELAGEVYRAQHALAELDVRRGERVALVVDDELAWPAWFLGALRAGVVRTLVTDVETAEAVSASGAP